MRSCNMHASKSGSNIARPLETASNYACDNMAGHTSGRMDVDVTIHHGIS